MFNTIEELRQLLTKEICTVTFTKKDGSEREMLCTTMQDKLPKSDNPCSEIVLVTPSPTTLTVWDLENDGWRSFRFDAVKEIYVG